MAEPIVRGSRKFNLWRWILAGIVAVFVVFTVANWSGGDEAETAVGEVDVVEGQQAAPAPSNGGPIRDSSQIAGVAPETLVGRRVELEGMTVAAVTGDRTFWAKPRGAEGELFVVLLESPADGRGVGEQEYVVNEGENIAFSGIVREFPGFDEAQQRWNVASDRREEFDDLTVYVEADRISKLEQS